MLRRVWVQNRKRKGKNGRRSKKAWRGKDRQAVCHVAGGGAGTRRCIVPHTGLVLSTCSMHLQTIRSKVWSTVWITEYQFTDYAVILYNNLSILYSVCGVYPVRTRQPIPYYIHTTIPNSAAGTTIVLAPAPDWPVGSPTPSAPDRDGECGNESSSSWCYSFPNGNCHGLPLP